MSFNTPLTVSTSEQSQKSKFQFEQDSDNIAKSFEQKGNLLFQDCSKLVYQCGLYVLKEVIITAPQTPSSVSSQQQQQTVENQVSSTYPPSPISLQSQQTEIDQQNQMLMMEKKIKDCYFLQNEFVISQIMHNGGEKHIAKPIDFKKTPSRCMLFSPFMSEKDAFTHLIAKNAGIFKKIDNSFTQTSVENLSEELKLELTKARSVLFGTMKLILQIGSALQYLHDELNIAHNDIKPDNFFAHYGQHPLIPCSNNYQSIDLSQDDDGVYYYLGDFGYSKPVGFSSQKEAKRFFLQKVPSYFTPEIFAWLSDGPIDHQNFEKQYDVFAFGISIFQILFQMNPYQSIGCHLSDFSFSLLQTNPDRFWAYLQKPLSVYERMTNVDLMKDLLSQMLERDPSRRPNISQVLQHPWLASIKNYFLQVGK